MPNNRTQSIQLELDILAIRRITTKIAIKLFESASDSSLIAEVNTHLSECDFSKDIKKVIEARDALFALAKKLNVDVGVGVNEGES